MNDVVTVAIVLHGAQSPATWPSGVQRAAIVRLPSASAHNMVWCHPLTHHLLSDNLWYLPMGPEFFPLYSATIFSLAKCLTFSKVVMQGRLTENQGPKTRRPFVLDVPSQCEPSVGAFLDRLSWWTFGLSPLVAELFIGVILSPPSLVFSLFLQLKQLPSCCQMLWRIRVRK